MPRRLSLALAFLLSMAVAIQAGDDLPLCGTIPTSYVLARETYPKLKDAIDLVGKQPVATWWTDNNPTYISDVQTLLDTCSKNSLPVIVVYGLPQRDCGAGFSNLGKINSTEAYLEFIKDLVGRVGSRPVLYIMEPDAIGAAADGTGCAATNGYLDNMQAAVPLLTANENARLYFDVGFWMLNSAGDATKISKAVHYVGSKSREGAVKGIVLNTSNLRQTAEMLAKCSLFVEAASVNTTYKCAIDTSRNFRTPNTTTEWCNNKYAALGLPPTSQTGHSDLLDYFLWVKVPGESDGECNTTQQSADAMVGPRAGKFFEKAFSMQWDRGYFVDKKLGKPLREYDLGSDFTLPSSGLSGEAIAAIVISCLIVAAGAAYFVRRRVYPKQKTVHVEASTPQVLA
ncbi:unnamed protein product [Aphanomyces euteiches]